MGQGRPPAGRRAGRGGSGGSRSQPPRPRIDYGDYENYGDYEGYGGAVPGRGHVIPYQAPPQPEPPPKGVIGAWTRYRGLRQLDCDGLYGKCAHYALMVWRREETRRSRAAGEVPNGSAQASTKQGVH